MSNNADEMIFVLFCAVIPVLIVALVSSEWFLPWMLARFGMKGKRKRELSPARRAEAKKWLNNYLDGVEVKQRGNYVNGEYSADLERYGKWYGIDPDDDVAKLNFLNDLDQDEDEERGER